MIVVSGHSIVFLSLLLLLLSLLISLSFGLKKENTQSYSLDEHKRSLKARKEIVKLYQTSKEPVTSLLAG